MNLDTLDQGFAQMAQSAIGAVRQPELIVEFSFEAMENEAKTKEAGRLICDDVEYVSIRVPGDSDVIRRPATNEDRNRYPRHYAAFKASQPQETASGTPLSKWPGSPALGRVREAAALGIHTVEQLAAVPDGNLPRLGPGWREIRQRAIDYLASAKDSAILFQLRAENDALKNRVAALESMVERQSKDIGAARDGTLAPVPASTALTAEVDALKAAVAELMAQTKKGKKG